MENWYVIYLTGKRAVQAGYAFQNGKCYRQILDDSGKFLAQLEVTLDSEWGDDADAVDVSFIAQGNVCEVLAKLEDAGFCGVPYHVLRYTDRECCKFAGDEWKGIIGESSVISKEQAEAVFREWFGETQKIPHVCFAGNDVEITLDGWDLYVVDKDNATTWNIHADGTIRRCGHGLGCDWTEWEKIAIEEG